MNCIICGMPENQYDVTSKKHIEVKHPKDVTGIICSRCVQILITSSQDKIRAAYQKAIDEGLLDKAEALKRFLNEEDYHVRETKKPKRSLIRKGFVRMVRPTTNQIRPQPPAL